MLPRDDGVEHAVRGIPRFEGGHLHLDAGPSSELGHSRVGVHAEHRTAGRLELTGLDTGAAADVEYVEAGCGGDDPFHQCVGIAGPGPVVTLGVHPERFGHPPVLVRFPIGRTGAAMG